MSKAPKSESYINSWRWNELEEDALDELSDARLEKLYLRGLRKHMDYGTGIVGVKRKVSYTSFYELLQEKPPRGSHRREFKPSRDYLRWGLKRLEEVGLIRKLKTSRRTDSMIFKLPLASLGFSGSQEEHPWNTIGGTPKENPVISRLSEYRNTRGATYEEPHTSGSGTSLSLTNKNICDAAWCFGEKQRNAVVYHRPDLLDRVDEVVAKFEQHYRATGEAFTDWDAAFELWILREHKDFRDG